MASLLKHSCGAEAEPRLRTGARGTDDDVVAELNFHEVGSFAQAAGELAVGFAGRGIPAWVVVGDDEGVRVVHHGAANDGHPR